jgi:hypothetical protein
MIFALPYNNIIHSNITIVPEFNFDKYDRKISLISYGDLYNLPIIFDKMKIVGFDKDRGRLQLDGEESPVFMAKINALQNHIINTVYLNRRKYFATEYTELAEYSQAQIQNIFQTFVKDNIITVYFNKRNTTVFYGEDGEQLFAPGATGATSEGSGSGIHFEIGQQVRLVFRIHGILLMNINNSPVPMLRIQYSIPYCYGGILRLPPGPPQ